MCDEVNAKAFDVLHVQGAMSAKRRHRPKQTNIIKRGLALQTHPG